MVTVESDEVVEGVVRGDDIAALRSDPGEVGVLLGVVGVLS